MFFNAISPNWFGSCVNAINELKNSAPKSTKNIIAEVIAVLSITSTKSLNLKFLSINGMYRAIGFDERNESYPQLTDHYFTGDYPVKPIDELGDNKITQLSLLSTASNN